MKERALENFGLSIANANSLFDLNWNEFRAAIAELIKRIEALETAELNRKTDTP